MRSLSFAFPKTNKSLQTLGCPTTIYAMNAKIVAFAFALFLANAASASKPACKHAPKHAPKPAPKPACTQDSVWLMNQLNDWFPLPKFGTGFKWTDQEYCSNSDCILLQGTNVCNAKPGQFCALFKKITTVLICGHALQWFCHEQTTQKPNWTNLALADLFISVGKVEAQFNSTDGC